jgi:hypothetical protein
MEYVSRRLIVIMGKLHIIIFAWLYSNIVLSAERREETKLWWWKPRENSEQRRLHSFFSEAHFTYNEKIICCLRTFQIITAHFFWVARCCFGCCCPSLSCLWKHEIFSALVCFIKSRLICTSLAWCRVLLVLFLSVHTLFCASEVIKCGLLRV